MLVRCFERVDAILYLRKTHFFSSFFVWGFFPCYIFRNVPFYILLLAEGMFYVRQLMMTVWKIVLLLRCMVFLLLLLLPLLYSVQLFVYLSKCIHESSDKKKSVL